MGKSRNPNAEKWWETGVIYQIYPLTFADSDGDGIGDLQGIIKKLDYLNDGDPDSEISLGIDAIWLSPINQSPMIDNGYDVSDYYDISDTFGSLEDFDLLLSESHQRGIKIILDLVVNHTSNQHSWFIASSQSKDNPKSNWYHWQDPAPDGGVPNNWLSYFGGTGWTFNEVRQQYYYHTFNENQPDLNWGHSDVKRAIFQVIRFWLDRGVDGFRLDASSVYSKDKYYRYNPVKFGATDKNNYNNQHHLYDKNQPENHHLIREIRNTIDEYEDRVLIGETFIDNRLYDSTMFYGVNNDELHLAFTFEFPFSPWYPGYLQREIIKKELITPEGAWPTYFLDNHDIPRHLSRWIECSLCTNPLGIAQASAAILLTIRGTPFLYYGQEIGMVDNLDIPPDQIKDKAIIKSDSGELPPPRDGARTPMQWNDDVNAGFSFGKDVDPWLPVNENYTEKNVEKELKDRHSLLNFYRQLIKARKNSEALRFGRWNSLIHYPYEHLAYTRKTEAETVLVLINFSYEKDLTIDEYIAPYTWEVLVSNEREVGKIIDLPSKLYPFEVSVLRRDN
ncbi:putative alpha-glucosidase [Crocosphaera subtropica ATCC 51142]|uniref:Alpha-glucosidase n=1 Tax=Crocosphaera subtropica (strain ATCC 51142 / BH68) TaxID=43989 RepID=B1WZT3_CROS5|nr:alpha-glucosidase [Crocosphaera subtropica]ACB52832.1 putative alpha-glucosidase [Crocosphaera subtropica ATCC 51142]